MYDDGTDEAYEADVMGGSAEALETLLIGHRIVAVERTTLPDGIQHWGLGTSVKFTLDNGAEVFLTDTDDCCAYTSTSNFEFLAKSDNAITAVTTENGFTKWHIYAEGIPVVDLDVDWSPGNPYYYGFGFDVYVTDAKNGE